MSNVQIPNLPAVASLSGDELFEGVQAGSSVKISLGQMIAAARTDLPTTVPLPVSAGGTGVTTSTGTGSVVLSDNPTLVNASISLGSFGLGTVGAPSITFTGDTNTGIWSPGADTVAISTGGAERMRVASTGFVGIGTTTPAQPLHIATSGATIAAAYVQNDTGNAGYFLRSQDTGVNTIYFGDTTDFQAGFIQYSHAIDTLLSRSAGPVVFQAGGSNERMRIDSAGVVGIGTAIPGSYSTRLAVVGGNVGISEDGNTLTTIRANASVCSIGSFFSTGSSLAFRTNPSAGAEIERMRIHATGGVSIGNTTDPGATNLSVSGSIKSSGAGGIGYSTGAGVAVTQLTSRTTPVPTTGNKTSGSITLFTTTAVVGTWFTFTVPNTAIAITDTVSLTVRGATNSYLAYVTAIVAGTSFTVTMASVVGTASDTPIVNFNIIRGVSA